MIRDGSDRITSYFDACAHDLTPLAERHAARVFYVPVSSDPEVTRNCSSVLSDIELQRAGCFAAQNDKTLFIQRRAFRRFCGARVLGTSQPLSQIIFGETENGRPYLSELPDVWFSFSSCRFGFAAAWSWTHGIGVDLEDQSRELEAVELARRFYSAAETRAVEGSAGLTSLPTFFQLWSLKEAALKSIGEGLPFGLDAFEFSLVPDLRVIHAPPGYGGPQRFRAHMVEGTERCIAMVIRSLS
jgi:phosphopantetheine--protein transferase-like protein